MSTAALRPLSALFGAVVGARNRWYDTGRGAETAPVPVISVGNLTVGGTGKTPMVAWLCRALHHHHGIRPAVVSRGYGGSAGRGPVRVSLGDGPRVSATVSGDEPHLLARTLPGVPVVVGSDRSAGARSAAECGADVVVLDDGFQHRRLHRDLDIVLLDGRNPFGGGRLLPEGRLREPPSSLARAGVVVLTRSAGPFDHADVADEVRGYTDAVIVRAGTRTVGFVDASGRPHEPPARVVAFCGIGTPEAFLRSLQDIGVEVVSFHPFRDHRSYRDSEVASLRAESASGSAALVTTEKDLSRLSGLASPPDPMPLALRVESVIWEPGPLLAALAPVIPGSPR